MKLYWTLEAIADRDAIFDYIETDNPAAALALSVDTTKVKRKNISSAKEVSC